MSIPDRLVSRDSQGTVHSDVIGYEENEDVFRVVADVFGGQENADTLAAALVHRFNHFEAMREALEEIEALARHVNALQHAHVPIGAALWSDLHDATNAARAALSKAVQS